MHYSLLDLSPVPEGFAIADALRNTGDLARHAEDWGYHRYWMAEHHNMPGIASAATAVLIGHVAGLTSRMRVGAGGIMLPNHAPLAVAEAFGTLATLYPDRIDLGLGRAPGGDHAVMRALGVHPERSEQFHNEVAELRDLLGSPQEIRPVRALPGRERKCLCGYLDHRCTGRRWRRCWACRMPLPLILRPPCWNRRWRSTDGISSPRSHWKNRMR